MEVLNTEHNAARRFLPDSAGVAIVLRTLNLHPEPKPESLNLLYDFMSRHGRAL